MHLNRPFARLWALVLIAGLFGLLAAACSDETTESPDGTTDADSPTATALAATSTPSATPSVIETASSTPTPEPTPVPTPQPTPIPTAPPTAAPTQAPAQACHPSYTGACLDPNASDYDCIGGSGDGPFYTGKVFVVGPDVFGLDRDNDGVGCE